MNNQLSDAQRAIVKHTPDRGHVLVLAAPGSGKTQVIAERVADLLGRKHLPPEQIIVMTFTEKAAAHLVERLEDRLGAAVQGIRIGTIHNICHRLLEQHGEAIGLRPLFKIFDAQRQEEALRVAAANAGYSLDDQRALGAMQGAISRRKRSGLASGDQWATGHRDTDDVLAIDRAYRALLREQHALDFDDLILNCNALLSSDSDTIAHIHKGIRYIFIDEFHDLSPEQFVFLTLLVPPMMPSRQVMVVADPNQAIYGWRDANAGRMLAEYRRLYQPQIFKMVENYRSAGNLVRAAQHLISGSGTDSSVVPVHPDDLPIDVVTCVDAATEAEWLAKQVRRARQSGRYSYGDIALLYRTNRRADLLEATLLREGVPLRREQEDRFFNNLDVQAMLRYLSLIQALSDEQFEPALYWPRVLVDEVTMTQLQRLAKTEGIPLSSLARRIDDYADKVSPLTRALIRDFVWLFDVELAQIADQPIVEIVQRLLSVLKQRRSPITYSIRENLKGILESLTGPLQLAVDRLAEAIATQRPVRLLHNGTIDSAAGAFILKHILEHYFQYPVEIQPQGQPISADTFVITFGTPRSADERGFGLSVYESRLKTLIYSISTQAWRIGQMLLMRYETQRNSQFVLFDLETTGTHIRTTEILEVAALEVVGGVETKRTFNALARPNGRISPEVSQVHGITEELVKDQPTIDAILPSYLDFLGNATLVGHNIETFDYPVLHRIANSLTLVAPIGPMIDTCKLARRLLPDNSHRLEALAQLFGYQEAQTHRALDDVRLNAKVFFSLLDLLDREREIDIASEVLPLVALGIRASNVPLTDYNLWIAQVGARAAASGLGQSLCQQLTDVVDDIWGLDDHEAWLAELPYADAEEDRRWNELTQRWQDALSLYRKTFDDQSLGAFLHYVRLASSIDYHDDDDDRVTLMTIHSAKGKEWPLVFVVGAEDGTIPSFRAKTCDEIDEERRVLYVAITRAKKRLCVTQVQSWSGYRKNPSRFLQDIPDTLITKRTIAVGQSK